MNESRYQSSSADLLSCLACCSLLATCSYSPPRSRDLVILNWGNKGFNIFGHKKSRWVILHVSTMLPRLMPFLLTAPERIRCRLQG